MVTRLIVLLALLAVGCGSRDRGPTGPCLELLAFCASGSAEECTEARRTSEKRDDYGCRQKWLVLNHARSELQQKRRVTYLGSMAGVIDSYEDVGQLRFRLGELRAGRDDLKTAEQLQLDLDAAYVRTREADGALRDEFLACPPAPLEPWLKPDPGAR